MLARIRARARRRATRRAADAAIITTAVCPACQVETGIPCRYDNGRPYPGIHPQRRTA